jgi:vesicular inhibitory amino acid transporter
LPSFEQVMNIMGSGFAVITAVMIPIWAGAAVFGWRWYSIGICAASGLVGVVGLMAAFWPEASKG